MSAPENPLAFPSVCLGDPGHPSSVPGMTLRDYFAAQALAGLMMKDPWGCPSTHASIAYNSADAMLAARGDAA